MNSSRFIWSMYLTLLYTSLLLIILIFIYLSIYPSIHPSIHPSIYLYTLQVRRSSLARSLAKDQALRGPLVYLGSIELSPFSPHVHRRQVFSTLVVIAPPIFYGIRATNDDRKPYRFNAEFDLNPIWNCWCIIGKRIFFNHLQITAPNGPFQFAMESH